MFLVGVTSEQFDRLCIDNPDLRLELSPNRELIVMAPVGGESSAKNADLITDVNICAVSMSNWI
jgi:Uma2 family endonuclease